MIGRLTTSLVFAPLSNYTAQVAIYDAFGAECLRLEVSTASVAFDAVKLLPGDYLLLLDAPNRLEACGSYCQPRSGTFDEPLKTPLLNDLLFRPRQAEFDLSPAAVGVPVFHFEPQ